MKLNSLKCDCIEMDVVCHKRSCGLVYATKSTASCENAKNSYVHF